MGLFVYVDNSNVWIEGQRVSAVAKGLAPDIFTAMSSDVLDRTWRYDFGRLYEIACPEEQKIGRSVLFGSRPPPNDSLWERARSQGFEPIVYDRNDANRKKKVDVHIATMMTADSFEYMQPDRDMAVLVAGDGDLLPPVELLQTRGISVRCLFWDHASRDLRDAASEFVSLNPHLEFLSGTVGKSSDA